jgi:hypothetical protein
MHPSEAPRDLLTTRVCLLHSEIYTKLIQNLPKNHEPNKVVGTSDLLIKHCTQYLQRPIRAGEQTVQADNLVQEIGNTYIETGTDPKAQWTRIMHLLHSNGFAIVRKEVE